MIKVAKAHERTCQEYQIHKQAHSMANPSNSYSNPLIQTNALSKSFQKGLPRRPVASVDAHTATVTAQLTEPHVASVAI